MKYLIVDDHAPMRLELRALLAGSEDEVCEAADSAEAEAVYEWQLPDWVIMDIQMAPVGGLTATRRIIARHPKARIVVITQFDDPDLRDVARNAGACSFVLKEDLSVLHSLIHEASTR